MVVHIAMTSLNFVSTVSAQARHASKSPSSERILLAVNPEERSMFLPQFESGFLGKRELTWFNGRRSTQEQWVSLLEEICPTVIVSCWSTPRIPVEYACAEESPLRYVCHMAGSVRLVPREFIERGGLVTNWGNAPAEPVAEHALLLGLAALRNLPEWRRFIARPGSEHDHPAAGIKTQTLYGQRVGIHGFGRVARALVALLKPFRVNLSVWSEGVPNDFIESHGATVATSLHGLFSHNDIIFECEALTEKSKSSVSAEMLASLPDGAVFVNVGRGCVVDQQALMAEAAQGRIRVAIDVTRNDPVRTSDPIYKAENIILSPHIAGPTWAEFSECGRFSLENLSRYLQGDSLHEVVTLAAYDRAT